MLQRVSGAGRNPSTTVTVFLNDEHQNISAFGTASTANRRTMATGAKRALTMENINPNIVKMEYAVRGPLVIRAGEIEKGNPTGTRI